MRIISTTKLKQFSVKHPQSGAQLNLIVKEFKTEFFENVNQIKQCFPYISVLKDNRIVMNVHGNDYRLVLWINYGAQVALVKFIGTHAEYDKIDANKV
ncbi:MAG: type II toxin-antitoxin system HigB family toxin [Salinivirgaceae bacterium]|jgi:mRNA interferase HigB|nr:type II toxin-antitoxin system HigB family toxin [Salinivirgaceae bacterium]